MDKDIGWMVCGYFADVVRKHFLDESQQCPNCLEPSDTQQCANCLYTNTVS